MARTLAEQSQPQHLPPNLSLAETHAHTTASDGMVSATELVQAAAEKGIRVLCITDHDTLGITKEAVALGKKLGVDVISGQEITTVMPPGIHIIGLFLERPIRMWMPLEDTVQAIHDQGGLAIIVHPFMPTWFASITPSGLRKLLATHHVDGIELRHTAPVLPGTWEKLDTFFAEHRSKITSSLGASDTHFGKHDIGRWLTAFPGTTAADFRKAVEQGLTTPFHGVEPPKPSMFLRLAQQYRSMIWLTRRRRRGEVGRGVGPKVGRSLAN